jgi:hypothetical protein
MDCAFPAVSRGEGITGSVSRSSKKTISQAALRESGEAFCRKLGGRTLFLLNLFFQRFFQRFHSDLTLVETNAYPLTTDPVPVVN